MTNEELVERVRGKLLWGGVEKEYLDDLATLSERLRAATRDGDPDYSPEYQDEYQRLWHETSERLKAARQRERIDAIEYDEALEKLETAEARIKDLEAYIAQMASDPSVVTDDERIEDGS